MTSAILSAEPLRFPYPCIDPFLFAVYHYDVYPPGEGHLGPPAHLLRGRSLGQDFGSNTGWNMYHGRTVPGFPKHPHRGFETVTVVRHGAVDHCDSTGAAGRFGEGGDVQWMTAGRGISHSEMFPLLHRDRENVLELFQVWLNLPRRSKMAEPNYKMFWAEDIPRATLPCEAAGARPGSTVTLAIIAGRGFLDREHEAGVQAPPPNSYASDPEADVAIVTIRLDAGGTYALPAALGGVQTRRKIFFFKGDRLVVDGREFPDHAHLELRGDAEVVLEATGNSECEILLLQGRPIDEPVVQHGPFVMSSRDEIKQAFSDYQKDEFGPWRHGGTAPVHPRDMARFAQKTDGSIEERPWPHDRP